jgi:hypothetical protein
MDTTRQARQSSGPTPYTVGDSYFHGMDTRIDPERLDPGICQSITNLLPSGNGSLTSRAGFQGMLTTAHAGSVYSMTRWVSSGGTIYFVYAALGKLWRVTKDGTSATEIKKTGAVSFTFTNNGRGVMMRRRGAYIYLIDSEDSSGGLYKLDMAGVIAGTAYATVLSGMTAPTTAPTATKYDTALINALDATAGTWTFDTLSTGYNSNMAANPWFDGGGTSGTDVGNYWKTYGSPKCYTSGSVASLPALSGTQTWLHLDDPDDRVLMCTNSSKTTLYMTNPTASNSAWAEGSSALTKYATRYDLSFDLIQIDTTSVPMWVKIQWFETAPTSDIDTPLIERNYEFSSNIRYKSERKAQRIDISDYVTGGDPKYYRVYIANDPAAAGTAGCYLTNFSFTPIYPEFAKTASTAYDSGIGLYLKAYCADNNLEGFMATYSPTTSISLTGIGNINFNFGIKGVWSAMPTFRLRFRNSTAVWISGEYTLSDTVSIDIANMPESIKSSITYLAFEFTSDATITTPPSGRASPPGHGPLYFISITQKGNLTTGASYTYWYSHINANGSTYAAGGIESSGSPLSATLDMSGGATRVKLVIPSSGYPASATYLAIWRLGGTMPDGDTRARLVAFVPVGANATSPTSTTNNDPTNKWYWLYASYTFYDNVPDADLVNAESYQAGRDLPITGAAAIAVHGDRIVLAKGGYAYFSWLIGDTENNGIYFTYSPDPSDPEVSIKGALLRVVGTGDSNKIVALCPLLLNRGDLLGNALAVMLSDTPPSLITGYTGDITSAEAFSVRPFPQEVGGGCYAWRTVLEAEGGLWYVAGSGMVMATNSTTVRKSIPLEGVYSLLITGPTSYAQSAALLHDNRVWLFAPAIGGTTGSIYVLDNRIPADKGWVKLSGSVGFTGGLSLSGGGDTGDLYLAGLDGQIYKYTGTSDKATPSGSAVAISLDLTTRRHGQSSSQGMGLVGVGRPYQLSTEVTTGATTAWTFTIANEYAQTHAKTWNITGSGRQEKTTVRGWHDLRGKVHSVRMQAIVTTQTVIRDYLIFMTEGGEVR